MSKIRACASLFSLATPPHPPPTPIPWLWPSKLWQHIHMDYAESIDKKMMLVVVNAHSKWPEVIPTLSSNHSEGQRNFFAANGLSWYLTVAPSSLELSLLYF